MAACLKCGFDLAENQSECPRCGVIVAKARPARPQPAVVDIPVTTSKAPTAPSPAPQVEPVRELRGNATKLRIFAAGIDNLLATIVGFFITSSLVRAMPPGAADPIVIDGRELPPDPYGSGWLIVAFGYLAYFFVLEGLWGTTPGKRLFGLRVVRLDGKPVGLWAAGCRTLLRIFEANPLLFGEIPGGLAILWSKRRQRIGDMIAGTVVVSRNQLAAVQQAHRPESLAAEGPQPTGNT